MNPSDENTSVQRYVLSTAAPDESQEDNNFFASGEFSDVRADLYLDIDPDKGVVTNLQFHIAGDEAPEGGSGVFDLQGWQSLEQSSEENGILDGGAFTIDVEAVYLDESIIRNSELYERSPHVFVSPRDSFSGQFSATVELEGETIHLYDAQLTLTASEDSSKYSGVQTIHLLFAPVQGMLRQPLQRDGNHAIYPITLTLELVRYEVAGGETGGSAQTMVDLAKELWEPGLITINSIDSPAVTNAIHQSDPTNGVNEAGYLVSRPLGGADKIPVFFVTFDLVASGDGGGVTNPLTALAAVFISEKACGLTLAHELGHVMGGDHPGDNLSDWSGDAHTILAPNPYEGANNTHNCSMAINPTPGTAAGGAAQPMPAQTWSLIGYTGC